MVSVEEALSLVLENQRDFGTEEVSLLQSLGRILAQDVFADRDFPPYHRVMMDGIAINSSAYNQGIRTFKIEKILAAGDIRQKLEDTHHCIEVMTGAVLPINTDAVIQYEQCEIAEGLATVKSEQVLLLQNVHKQGTDSKKGELLVNKFTKITPAIIGILASVGLSEVTVLRTPKVAICSSGDELVDVSAQPQDHQVRRSNVYMLASALRSEGIVAETIHLPDNVEIMTSTISSYIDQNDVILFSGAVSRGKFDYLPAVLEKLNLKLIFHTVAQRPGKPFLFGKFTNGTLAFGFPGNPVSTFVCYHQFFKKWLHAVMHCHSEKLLAKLSSDVNFKPSLSYHLMVQIKNEGSCVLADPITGSTSGDLVTLTKPNGIVTLPPDRDFFAKGEEFEFNPLF